MEQTKSMLISLIGNEVCGNTLSLPAGTVVTDDLLAQAYDVAKAHDVVHIIGSSLMNNNLLFGSAYEGAYRKAVYDAVMKSENQSYILEEISSAFEAEKISHILLKGSVIKNLYPQSWLRTSRDIDILVHKEDLPAAAGKLCDDLGFTRKSEGRHDVSFVNDEGICIELHFSLMEKERIESYSAVLDRVWDYATAENGGYRNILCDEMAYFYHIAHMAKHFKVGGCGLRPFVDLCLMEKKMTCHTEKLTSLLKEGGLLKFAAVSKALGEAWFSGGEHTAETLAMERYILDGGAFGSEKTRKEANKIKGDGKYIRSRLFVPYDYLKVAYPIVGRYKFLFPIFEFVRIFSFLFGKKKKFRKKYLEEIKNISDDKANEIKGLFEYLEL